MSMAKANKLPNQNKWPIVKKRESSHPAITLRQERTGKPF
jgi:hypothetical protein